MSSEYKTLSNETLKSKRKCELIAIIRDLESRLKDEKTVREAIEKDYFKIVDNQYMVHEISAKKVKRRDIETLGKGK